MGNLCGGTNSQAVSNFGGAQLSSQAKGGFKKELKTSSIRFKVSQFAVLNPGKFTDHYEIGEFLGEGGFGSVSECKHIASKQMRAVKLISKEGFTKQMRIDFIHETDILKSLAHQNIITIYEMYEDQAQFYLITELCKGGDLFEEISRRGNKLFKESEAAHIIKECLLAINHCHSEKICHRDLKPENILLDTDNRVKLIDFGTAESFDKQQGMEGLIGTAYYIAPEVLNSKGKYDEKCDIWSLGVILYMLLTGIPPFNGRTEDDIFRAIKKGAYSAVPLTRRELSASGKDLIKKMLTFSSAARCTAGEALKHAWFQEFSKSESALVTLEESSELIANLKSFHEGQKLHRIAMSYITSQLASKEEMKNAEKIFRELDSNNDGKIDKEELIKGFRPIYGDLCEQEVSKIFKAADLDGSGQIDINEWKAATAGQKGVVTKERLLKAFQFFDKDNSGSISIAELKEALGYKDGLIEESVWENLIKEVDRDSNGEIDFEEFSSMMMLIAENVSLPGGKKE